MSASTLFGKLIVTKPVQHSHAGRQFGSAAGVYVIWGSPTLVKWLAGKRMLIHASKELGGSVSRDLSVAISDAKKITISNDRYFCLYVGKSANFQKRHAIRRYEKLTALLDGRKLQEIKGELFVSFLEIQKGDWISRFYLEEFAIGSLIPVLNAQPER